MRRFSGAVLAVGLAWALAGCGLLPGPLQPRSSDPRPEIERGADFEYAAVERAMAFSHDSEGVLRLEQSVIFDAGEQGHSEAVSVFLGPEVTDYQDDVRIGVDYQFSELRAVEVTDPEQPVELTITTSPSEFSEGAEVARIGPPGQGWAPGRHRVVFEMRIDGAWRTIDGRKLLLLPHASVSAPWYPYTDGLEYTTLSADGLEIGCMSRQGKAEVCSGAEGVVESFGDFPGLGSSGDGPRFYFVTPTDITAEAPPPARLAVRPPPQAPNPYGEGGNEYRIEVLPDGGYQVEHTATQEMRLKYSLSFSMAMPDWVRLPDAEGQPLPGLLVSPVTGLTVERDGQPIDPVDSSIGHRIGFEVPSWEAEPGDYTVVWNYTRTAASIAGPDGLVYTYLTLPTSGEYEVETPGELVEVRCQQRPGVFVSCPNGSLGNYSQWGPQIRQVVWRSADAQSAPAEITHQ